MRAASLKHQFVTSVSEQPEEGILYVSLAYRTAIHKCCCGCGHEVVTPFSPTDWQLTFDGVSVSLYPSIGNWSLACRSHYWIKRGKVQWAGQWSDEEIAAGRAHDRWLKDEYYGTGKTTAPATSGGGGFTGSGLKRRPWSPGPVQTGHSILNLVVGWV